MEVFLGFLICTLLIGLGISIGVVIEATKSLKKLGEINKAVDNLASEYEDSIKSADAVIETLRQNSQDKSDLIIQYDQDFAYIYEHLVLIRDQDGVEGLDEVIGRLGQILDDGSESKEESNG